jgi:hypothetical protein
MKRFMTIISALSVLTVASSAFAQGIGWTISSSAADANANTGTAGAPGTLTTLFLHYACNNTPPSGPGTGMTAMEADLSVAPLAPLAVMNGFLNAGTANQKLLLVVGGCPTGPLVAGSLLYLNTGIPLNICLQASADNGFNLTVDCGGNGWDNGYTGYAENGASPCSTPLCPTVSVEDETWGGIKSLYR